MAQEKDESRESILDQLLKAFTPPDYAAWKEAAETTLKGAPFEKKLVTPTYEGIDLQPIYLPEDVENAPHLGGLPGFPPYVRGTKAAGYAVEPWRNAQALSPADPEEFNRAAQYDLPRGQTGLTVVLDSATVNGLDPDEAPAGWVGDGGLSLATTSDWQAAFQGVDFEQTPLFLDAGASALPLTGLAVAAGAKPKGVMGADPLGRLAVDGRLPMNLDRAYEAMSAATRWAEDNAPGLRTVIASGLPVHNAGGGAAQELAFALAAGVSYMRALMERGLSADQAAGRIAFTFGLGANFFMEIAKLRAARLLWANAVDAFGGGEEAQKMFIHARTSSFTKTEYDPYVNMLRNTTEALAGVMGGVDAMHVAPFDEPLRGQPDEFSRRVSRNLQIILKEEAHLTHPVDPGGGAWYVESLTDQIAQKAWAAFQEMEAAGGLYEALKAGTPQKEAAGTAEKMQNALGVRKDVIVGVNMYPNLAEKPLPKDEGPPPDLQNQRAEAVKARRNQAPGVPSTLDLGSPEVMETVRSAFAAGASLGQVASALKGEKPAEQDVTPFAAHRRAVKYERLRRNADEYLAETGQRLQVFPANIGPLAHHKPRLDFTTGFFAVGGFEVLSAEGHDDPEKAAEAAVASKAPIVVVCGTDKAYPDFVPPLVRKIKEKNDRVIVILAGKPAKEVEASYFDAGLDEYIFIRSNCYDILRRMQAACGLPDVEEA